MLVGIMRRMFQAQSNKHNKLPEGVVAPASSADISGSRLANDKRLMWVATARSDDLARAVLHSAMSRLEQYGSGYQVSMVVPAGYEDVHERELRLSCRDLGYDYGLQPVSVVNNMITLVKY